MEEEDAFVRNWTTWIKSELTFDFWRVEWLHVDLSVGAGGFAGGEVGEHSQVVATFWQFSDEGIVDCPVLETGIDEHS